MCKCLYVVRDVKAEFFGDPMLLDNDAIARRLFFDAARDPDTSICKHPEDYALYLVGTYDARTGVISALDTPVHLGNASEAVHA